MLAAVRVSAEREHTSIGRVLSALATRNGLPVLPATGGRQPVTLELVNQLRDALP